MVQSKVMHSSVIFSTVIICLFYFPCLKDNSNLRCYYFFSIFFWISSYVPSLTEPGGLYYAEDSSEEDEEEEEEVVTEGGLGITGELAAANYEYAGTRVEEIPERITIEDNLKHIDPRVDAALDEVDRELALPYQTAPFQRVVINLLGAGTSVVLVSECGSGKMDCATKGILVMRKVMEEPRGLMVVVQPLTNIMMEKMRGVIGRVAVLSMGQEMTVMEEGEGRDKAVLSCSLEELLSGRITVLIGHPESFSTPRGRQIMAALAANDRILGITIDEFHQVFVASQLFIHVEQSGQNDSIFQGAEGHWKAFRPDMLRIACGLRIYSRKGSPVVVMTATTTMKEIVCVEEMLVLRTSPVVLYSNPVLPYHKYSVIRRPANCRGLLGCTDSQGRTVPGLWHLLLRLYIKEFLAGVQEGVPAKRAIIFFKNNATLGAVYALLQQATGQMDPSTADFAMNHSSLLPADDLMLDQRRDIITLYLASNKMLLGTDLSNIDLVIIVTPYDQPAAILQAAGRMSRRTGRPYRTAGHLYLLFNGSDLTTNNKNMSDDVRRVCREGSTTCTRDLLEEVFKVDTSRWQVGPRVVEEVEEVEEREEREEREGRDKEEGDFQLLQRRIGDCRNQTQLMRLLLSNSAMCQMMATSLTEEGSSHTPARMEEGATNHCCHKHDLDLNQ